MRTHQNIKMVKVKNCARLWLVMRLLKFKLCKTQQRYSVCMLGMGTKEDIVLKMLCTSISIHTIWFERGSIDRSTEIQKQQKSVAQRDILSGCQMKYDKIKQYF